MTDQRDKAITEPAGGVEEARTEVRAGISRRAVLHGATAAVPTILTLKSGAAVAATSNLVTASANPGTTNNQYVALNTTGQSGPAYDYTNGEALLIPVALYVDDRDLSDAQRTDLINGKEVKDLTRVLTADKLCTNQRVRYYQVSKRDAGSGNVFYKLIKSDYVPQCAYLSVTAWASVSTSQQVTATPLF
jgi:hypothetical protein